MPFFGSKAGGRGPKNRIEYLPNEEKKYSLGNCLKATFFSLNVNVSGWTELPPHNKDFSGKPRADAGRKYSEQQTQMLGPLAGHGNLTVQSVGVCSPEEEMHRAIGFLDRAKKETKGTFFSLPHTPSPSLQELRAGKRQLRGPSFCLMLKSIISKHMKIPFFEIAIVSTLHTRSFL